MTRIAYEKVLKTIITGKEKDIKKALSTYKTMLKKEGLQASIKNNLIGTIDEVLNINESTEVTPMSLLGIKKTYDFTDTHIKYLNKLKEVISSADNKECEHEHLDIIALMQGGGFFPNILVPELYCSDCDLNRSLPTLTYADSRFEQRIDSEKLYGISISEDLEAGIKKWITTKLQPWIGVEEIVSNPKETYKQAPKYNGDISGIKIVDKKKLESRSSQ